MEEKRMHRPWWLVGIGSVLTTLPSGILLLWMEYRSGLFIRPEPPPSTEAPPAEGFRKAVEPHETEGADLRRQVSQAAASAQAELAGLRAALEDARKQAREAAARQQATEERLAGLRAGYERELVRERREAAQTVGEKEAVLEAADTKAKEASRARVEAAVARSAGYRPAASADPRPADSQLRPYPVDRYPNGSGYYGWR
jgi:hypothetical protein